MTTLGQNRDLNSPPPLHLSDHLELHRLHDIWDGHDPTDYLTVVGTQQFRQTKRIATLADAAFVTPDTDAFDGGHLASLSQNTTINSPTGTPTDFQTYVLRYTTTIARTLTFGGAYRGGQDVSLPPTTTGGGFTDYLGFQWNAQSSTWDLIAKVTGY